MFSKKLAFVALTAALTQGCATILSEETTSVNLSTSNGKKVEVEIEGQKFMGPGVINLKKGDKDVIVKTSTEGCASETVLKKEIEPVFFINVISGGPLGSTTDMATKKMWKYQDTVTITCQ